MWNDVIIIETEQIYYILEDTCVIKNKNRNITMVFMRILDIITEMESSKTCMLSILGDGGVTVIQPNHSMHQH